MIKVIESIIANNLLLPLNKLKTSSKYPSLVSIFSEQVDTS